MAQTQTHSIGNLGATHKPAAKVTASATPNHYSNTTELPKTGLFRFKQFQHFLPCSRETWRLRVIEGRAPQPLKMGQRCTVWRAADIHAWLNDPVNYRAQREAK